MHVCVGIKLMCDKRGHAGTCSWRTSNSNDFCRACTEKGSAESPPNGSPETEIARSSRGRTTLIPERGHGAVSVPFLTEEQGAASLPATRAQARSCWDRFTVPATATTFVGHALTRLPCCSLTAGTANAIVACTVTVLPVGDPNHIYEHPLFHLLVWRLWILDTRAAGERRVGSWWIQSKDELADGTRHANMGA